jgi:Domain of unknown function (DUF4351)
VRAPMHNRSDQFGKSILRDALSRASTAETEVEVLAATQRIDVYSVPDPARDAERAEMGLLDELAAEPSLFEPFRNTPTLRELRRCVNKQHTWHHELERRARAWERSIATPLLIHFKLENDEAAANEEDEMGAEIQAWYEKYQQKLQAEKAEARNDGERRLLLRLLRARFGELPAPATARIEAADVAELDRWGDRVLGAQTLDEVLDEPS